jgi:hypothetical protein
VTVPAHRWPPLEERILAALAGAAQPVEHRDLLARLEVLPGNEWILEEALADLLAAGTLTRAEGAGGSTGYRITGAPAGAPPGRRE